MDSNNLEKIVQMEDTLEKTIGGTLELIKNIVINDLTENKMKLLELNELELINKLKDAENNIDNTDDKFKMTLNKIKYLKGLKFYYLSVVYFCMNNEIKSKEYFIKAKENIPELIDQIPSQYKFIMKDIRAIYVREYKDYDGETITKYIGDYKKFTNYMNFIASTGIASKEEVGFYDWEINPNKYSGSGCLIPIALGIIPFVSLLVMICQYLYKI